MTAEQLTWWQVSHGLSNSQAAIRLCMSRRHFIRLRRGLSPIPGYLGLVCAAIAAGVPPWTSEPPKNDPKAMPGGDDLSFRLMRARGRARRAAQRQN